MRKYAYCLFLLQLLEYFIKLVQKIIFRLAKIRKKRNKSQFFSFFFQIYYKQFYGADLLSFKHIYINEN